MSVKPRFLFVCALVCAAVMCSASPVINQLDNGVNVLRSLCTAHNEDPPLSTALLSREAGSNSETEKSGDFRGDSSVTERPSTPVQFHYGQNSNKQPGTEESKTSGGHAEGGLRSTGSIFTGHSQYGRRNLQKSAQPSIHFYNYLPIIRKPPQKEVGGPFHQSVSQPWPPDSPQKTYNEAEDARNYTLQVTGDKTGWKSSDSPLLSSHADGYRSTASGEHCSGYKEADELAVARVRSTYSGAQSSEFVGFASQTAAETPSISRNLDVSVIRSNPSPSSITGVNRVAGDGVGTLSTAPRRQQPSASQAYARLWSQFQQVRRRDPQKEEQQLPDYEGTSYHSTNVAQHDAQTHSSNKRPPVAAVYSTAQSPTQFSSGNSLESFAPMHHGDSQYSYAPTSEKLVLGGSGNTATGGSVCGYKPGPSMKNLYGFRGFENPTGREVKESSFPSSEDRNGFQPYKGKDYGSITMFKNTHLHPFLSLKYSLQVREPSTTTTSPVEPETTPTDYSAPSPGVSHFIQTTTVSAPGLFRAGSKEVQTENNAFMDGHANHGQFSLHKRIYGVRQFASRPLEGAEASVREGDKPAALQQELESFELRRSHIWQPKSSRIHRWHDPSNISTPNQDLVPVLTAAGSSDAVKASRFSADRYKKNHNTYAFLGFQYVHRRTGNANIKSAEQNPSTASPTHKAPTAYLRSAEDLQVESSLMSEPRTSIRSQPAALKARLLNSPTSKTARGRRVEGKHGKMIPKYRSQSKDVAIVRLLKGPATVGSASFRGVGATTQAPTKDEDYSADAVTVKQEGNASRSPEVDGEDGVEEFSSVDGGGGGNEGFNLSDVVSDDTTKSQGLGEDLLELDYLQKSTGNISFVSVKLSHSDK